MNSQAPASELLQHDVVSPDLKGIDQDYADFKRRVIEAAKTRGGVTI